VTFQDDITRMLAEGYERMQRDTMPVLLGEAFGGPKAEPQPTITAHRVSAFLPMSTEQLLDAGLITEEQARAQGWTPYVPPPVPWHRRARWRWQSWRERAGRKAGGWIAGVDLTERDDY
jgi:hypothetical protein